MGIGRTNAGGAGGGVGGVLTVTAPAGVVVEVSKDGKTKRKTSNAEGIAVFKGLETGTWTLTITDGQNMSTKTVVITADYSATIAFFASTITITYPAGSICTCSDGKTTLTAPNTSGTWKCVVPNAGTWTASCTDGQLTASSTVSITADGQSKTATLAYALVIFQSGKGAVQACDTKIGEHATMSVSTSKVTFGYHTDAYGADGVYHTKSKINTAGYETLRMTVKVSDRDAEYGNIGFGLMSSTPIVNDFNYTDWVSSKEITGTSSTAKTYDCPISGSGSYYIALAYGACAGEITDIRLIK